MESRVNKIIYTNSIVILITNSDLKHLSLIKAYFLPLVKLTFKDLNKRVSLGVA